MKIRNTLLILLTLGLVAASPAAFGKKKAEEAEDDQKRPKWHQVGNHGHMGTFRQKGAGVQELINEKAGEGWRLVATDGNVPMGLFFEKSSARYQYKVVQKLNPTKKKALKNIGEHAKGGWKFVAIAKNGSCLIFEKKK